MARNAEIQLGEDGVFEVERDGEWIYSNLPQPDPNWSTTDSNGHRHAYQAGEGSDHYPTLRTVYGEPYWCDACGDEHTDSWLVCRECGEKIKPRTRIDSSPQWIAGRTSYRLNGEEISPEQAQVIMEEQQRRRMERKREEALASPIVARAQDALAAEGLTQEQIRRIVDRMVDEQ